MNRVVIDNEYDGDRNPPPRAVGTGQESNHSCQQDWRGEQTQTDRSRRKLMSKVENFNLPYNFRQKKKALSLICKAAWRKNDNYVACKT